MSLLQYNIISYTLLLPIILNLFLGPNNIISAILGGVFLIIQSIFVGQSVSESESYIRASGKGLFTVLIFLTILSTPIYYIFNLSLSWQSIILIILPVISSLLFYKTTKNKQKQLKLSFAFPFKKIQPIKIVLISGYALLMMTLFYFLYVSSTSQPITSPWNVIPSSFWIIFFLATLILIILNFFYNIGYIAGLLNAIHIFLVLSLGIIIYKVGFGFDPFLHEATMQAIADQGQIQPKQLYYLGHYTLIVNLSRLLGISIAWLNKYLVAILASIFVPIFTSDLVKSKISPLINNGLWLSLIFLMLPISIFTLTTPQSLANLFFIMVVLSSFCLIINNNASLPLPILWLVALAIGFIHPLAGMPAIIFLAIITFDIYKEKYNFPKWLIRSIYSEIVLVGSFAISILFLINGKISHNNTTFLKNISKLNFDILFQWWPIHVWPQSNKYRDIFYEFFYFFSENIWWILTVLVLICVFWFSQKRKLAIIRSNLLIALILIINSIVVSTFLEFPEIISYEKQEYAIRLFHLAFYSLLPVWAIGFVLLFKKISKKTIPINWTVILMLSFFVTASLFSAYPRNNKYEIGHQYATSQIDIDTVKKIDQISTNNYIVLANQSVSAAAIKQFGFKKYYQMEDGTDQFYYPLPTSSELYKSYLDMVNEYPSRQNAEKAAKKVGVKNVYLIINDYWNNNAQLLEQAKSQADEWITIGDGNNFIFIYNL